MAQAAVGLSRTQHQMTVACLNSKGDVCIIWVSPLKLSLTLLLQPHGVVFGLAVWQAQLPAGWGGGVLRR